METVVNRPRHRLFRALAILCFCVAAAGCAATTAYRRGEEAEKREDWDRAVVEYVRAVAASPGNTHYSVSLARAKIRASAGHFERGKVYARARQLELAAAEFEQTIFLDPANQYAMIELQRVREEIRKRQMTPGEIELAKARAKKKSLAPAKLSPQSNLPIVLKFKDQPLGKIYDTLSKASGVNFLYDERVDLKQTQSVDIANVTFEKAMDILMLQNKHFFKIIDENTILIAPDNRQKRQEYEDRVIRTFYLSNGDTKQVNTVLRQLLEARKVAENTQLNSITIKDSPDVVQVAEKIIDANDKAKAELVVDVELLELNRTKLQELGMDLTSKTLSLLFQGGNTSIPLNNLDIVKEQANWSIGPIPGVVLLFAKQLSDSKVIAKPQVRVTEGEKAELHIGDRVPIPSTTFNTSNTIGTSVVPITSFTYQNVGIEISMEPRVHHNREITLKLNVTVSSVSGYVQGTGGVDQPIIGQRQIQTVIRLKDGETNLLAGLIREEDTRSVGGVPGLSDIPVLNRIFGKNVDKSQKTDIVLTLTPHIIRIPDITDQDLEAIWVGTEERVQLRQRTSGPYGETPFGAPEGEGEAAAAGPPVPAAEAPPKIQAGTPSQAAPKPTQAPQPATAVEEEDLGEDEEFYEEDEEEEEEEPGAAAAAPVPSSEGDEKTSESKTAEKPQPSTLAQVILSSPKAVYAVGEQVPIEIRVMGAQNVGSIPFHLRFNPQVLEFVAPATEGDFMNSDGAPTVFVATPVQGGGEVVVGASRVGQTEGASGAGTLATMMFVAKAAGPANFTFTGAAVKDPNAVNLPASFTLTPVSVQGK